MREIIGLLVFLSLAIIVTIVPLCWRHKFSKSKANESKDLEENILDICFPENKNLNSNIFKYAIFCLLIFLSIFLVAPVVLTIGKFSFSSISIIITAIFVMLLSIFYAIKKHMIRWK